MNKVLIILSCLTFIGCAQIKTIINEAGDKTFAITSNPAKAAVYLYNPQTKSYIKIGQTPIEIREKDGNHHIFSNDYLSIRVAKSGYVIENFTYHISKTPRLNLHSDLKRIEAWNDVDREISSTLANGIAESVQRINRYVLAAEHDLALNLLEDLLKQYPKAYIFHDIKGSLHILKGENKEGIAAYKKSLQINPDNIESKLLLDTLREGKSL